MKQTMKCMAILIMAMTFLAPAIRAQAPVPSRAEEKKDEAPREDGERRQFLEVIGSLAAGQLYQGYLNIGLLADGWAEDLYDEDDARQLLASVSGLLDTLDKQMARLDKLPLDKEDRQAVRQVRKLSGLLRRQVEELEAFWKTGDKEHGAAYEKLRQEAWSGVSALLQLESDIGERVALLLKALLSREAQVRLEAAEALGKLGPDARAAVPALVAALKEKSAALREAAGQALGKIGADAVPALVELLKGEDAAQRLLAAQVLGLCGPEAEEAVPALIAAIGDTKSVVRLHAVLALGKVGPAARAAIPALQKCQKDPDANMRTLATAALRAIQQD
jgi:HEAT repeat protein